MCFILVHKLPDAPILKGIGADPNLQVFIREKEGLYEPILAQLWRYIVNIFRYNYWGTGFTIYPKQLVTDIIADKMKYSVVVNLYSILFAIPIGLILGIYAALRKNKWQDHVISVFVVIFISVPSFVYAFLVQYFLCFKLGWFELRTYSLDEAGGLLTFKMFYSMIPAMLSLGFGVVAGLTRYTRAELSEVLTSEFMLLARTKGLTKRQATVRHAMKNAMVVILPMIIGEFIGIMSGSLIIEGIFSIPGIGPLYITSIQSRDYNFFMALTVFYTFIGLLAGIVIDISYGFIDPRIRMGQR
jgi:oligopeptide transport system permease protein